jgi:hypothetical protein
MRSGRHSNLPVSMGLPRQLYWFIIGLVAWLVISVWGFVSAGHSALALTVVSLFIAIAVGLPLILALIAWRHRPPHTDHAETDSFREWLGREFDAHTGRLKGTAAAIQVILPIAAVAFGMTIFALVHHFDVGA